MQTSLSDKTYVVTGGTAGIGLAVVEQLAERGAWTIVIARSAERCRAMEDEIRYLYPGARLSSIVADLSLQSEVRRAAGEVGRLLSDAGLDGLDGLVNNAGTFTYWLALTKEGFETQWAVNHLAPFLLTRQLLPWLQRAATARVVTVSSGSHYTGRLNWDDIQLRRRYNGLAAYDRSKLANVLFTIELNRRLGPGSGLRAFAADPGLVKTDIGFKGTPPLVRWVWQRRRAGGISPAESARGIVYLLTEPSIQQANEPYWKHGQPKAPSPRSRDRQAARRLWDLSESMCGLSPLPYPDESIAEEGEPHVVAA
ncbi:MAG: SDR family oxidoreductase [Chloroflexi bacterium]|nr:SDR family oxidoreductase [Chloroflexota bacterium]